MPGLYLLLLVNWKRWYLFTLLQQIDFLNVDRFHRFFSCNSFQLQVLFQGQIDKKPPLLSVAVSLMLNIGAPPST